ncbi:hypothetical protein PPSQR21_038380 [Paenibacillus polymyxa SQR-21]|uniref:hypothetical protein n=1 Tax=Paenibacillus polymyxa TaxID=1406 RepID=UPI00042E5C15|nr:hypothetical protein [Paenibacillus polymyxa]AHM67476.1 hypothetical protein PPSQR21_038380 [Paenibacillus polymyxa SQR-21]
MEDINPVPAEDVPVQDVPVQDVPVQDVPVQDVPVQDAPVQDVPVQDAPVQDAPVHSILDDVYAYQHADIKTNVMDALSGFYKSHVEGSIQVFHSLTVGEAAIVVMLAAILLVLVFKWIWEVVRSA